MEPSTYTYEVTEGDRLERASMEEEGGTDSGPALGVGDAINDLVVASRDLSLSMADFRQQVSRQPGHNSVMYTCPVPSIRRFSGQYDGDNLREWIREAKEQIERLGLTGRRAVTQLCGFLDNPALRRVRNCQVEDPDGLFNCLERAFGTKYTFIELETQLRERIQGPKEGVWEFMDVLQELEEKMQKVRPRSEVDRKWVLVTWFCRNLRDRKIGVRAQQWWDELPGRSIEDLVTRVEEKVREAERITREEKELQPPCGGRGMVRELQGRTRPPCSFCGKVGHLGYQCEKFPGKQPGNAPAEN